ncbi:hypothetical protein PFLUV_G00121140 [Perca fluviatilis]|uniref:Uncharacterized protein n=1 Tax=Perca fluviatilis TaxID=8168 RepID=A0A6A5ER24_PERFL|nr:hypothetical protein PFLUV_G00121140 [Perca fluviatilis]
MRGAFPQEALLRDASFMFAVLCTLSSPSSLFLAGSQNSFVSHLYDRDALITNSTKLGGRFSAGYKVKEGGLSR